MREVVVYMHGLVPVTPRRHTSEYRAMHEGLSFQGIELPDFDGPDVIEVELWWDAGSQAEHSGNLARAQSNIGALLPHDPSRKDMLTAGVMKGLRELLQYAWSDAFYYTAEDGEERTRHDVWKQILTGVTHDEEVDLTIVCHSGGTLVAHDFLFYLFSDDRRQQRQKYADADLWAQAESKWRIRRLVTMGSPLAPLMVRSVALVDKFAGDPTFRLDVNKLGFDRGSHGGGESRWLNVWDVHDILSFPIGGLYDHDPRIHDLYPDVGDWPASAHDKYWASSRTHSMLAQRWD